MVIINTNEKGVNMDKNNKKYLALGGTIVATMLLGAYTQSVSWIPELRTIAHFCGAVAVPGFTSFFVSNEIYGYEERKNKRLNQDKDGKQNDKYQVNPKIKDTLMKASMLIGSIGYIAFCFLWENWQFTQTNIFQLPQYIADMVGPIVGMLTIGTVDCKPLYKKIDTLMDKIFKKDSKEKENTKENELNIVKEKENLPYWDLRLYKQPEENYKSENITQKKIIKVRT